jgi:hypothetical protein
MNGGMAGVTIANNAECIVISGYVWEKKESPIETKKERSQFHELLHSIHHRDA